MILKFQYLIEATKTIMIIKIEVDTFDIKNSILFSL